MQEFEVKEKKPFHREYLHSLKAAMLGIRDALKEFEYKPTQNQAKAIDNLLKEKLEELEKWV